jgi:predicted ABC-type ATPase
MVKQLYIIAGCNGAGKTTASFTILPQILNCKEFVNADEIAKGLSPFQPETVSFEAGRIMLNRINELISDNRNFAFETTLATRSYRSKIHEAKAQGYHVTLLFFWLQSIELAIERVRVRVTEGGHHIDAPIIARRYGRGLQNLFDIYLPICDEVLILDNSGARPELIAEKHINSELQVVDESRFLRLKH